MPKQVAPAPTKTPLRAPVPPRNAPTDAQPIKVAANGSAGGGQAPSKGGGLSQMLMIFGLAAVAAGGSWGFYYFLKPPKD